MSVDQPLDRFGEPVPPDPGYKEIWNADGTKPRSWEKIVLGAGLTVVSDPANKCSVLDVPGGGGASAGLVTNVAALRAYTPAPSGRLTTQGYLTAGDGGGWAYDWNSSSTATDDGVLVIKIASRTTGRLLAVRAPDGVIPALACGTLADGLAFDPSTVVSIDAELLRVTQLLTRAGWAGIDWGGSGIFGVTGGAQISPRTKGTPFVMRNGRFKGPAMTESAQAIGFPVRGKGEAIGSIGGQVGSQGYRSQTWTQTLTGGEITMNGIAQVAGAATVPMVVGETCLLRIGAEQTDENGWSANQYYATIKTITPTTGNSANVVFVQNLAEAPPPGGAGINTTRIQTQHDLVIIDVNGFQDNLKFENCVFDNVFLAGLFDRNTETVNCRWTQTTIGLNLYGSQDFHGDLTFDWATGYDQPEPGLPHYGYPVNLNSCVGTNIRLLKAYADTDSIVSEELSCRGTTIGVVDLHWDGRDTRSTQVAVVAQTGGSINTVQIGHLILRGGYYTVNVSPTTVIGFLTNSSRSASAAQNIRGNVTGGMLWRGTVFKSARQFDVTSPLAASSTSAIKMPVKGLFRYLRVFPSSVTGITSGLLTVVTGANTFTVGLTGIGSWVANRWNDISEAAWEYSQGNDAAENGVISISVDITTDGTVPSGTFLAFQGEAFFPELEINYVATTPTDTSYPAARGGASAPSTSADFIGQWYTTTAGAQYRAKSTGLGASDWQAIGVSDPNLLAIAGLTSAANKVPYFTGSGTAAVADFTATGRSVVECADAAALTALSDVATTSLKGLQSAADKEKEDRLPVRIDLATGTNTATTYTSPTWTASTYRRLQLVIRGKSTAVSGGPSTFTLVGASGTEMTTIIYTNTGATVGPDTQASLYLALPANAADGRFNAVLDIFIPTTDWKTFCGVGGAKDPAASYRKTFVYNGEKQDDTNAVTGITVLFAGACDYVIELWGYP